MVSPEPELLKTLLKWYKYSYIPEFIDKYKFLLISRSKYYIDRLVNPA